MPYWQNVVRSFEIPWRHKYLWLLALFAGESGGFSLSGGQGLGQPGGNPSSANTQQVTTWLSQNAGLLLLVGGLSLLAVVGLFILAAVCEGGLIRGAAEHDAERPFRLGAAWRGGVGTMWLIVRFRLLLVALVLPALFVFGLLVTGFVLAVVNKNVAFAIVLGLVGLLFLLGLVVYSIYLSLLDRLGSRTAVLDQRPAIASLIGAHRLLTRRFGRVLLVWLISAGVGIVVGLAFFVVALVAGLPAIISLFVLIAGGPGWLWFVFALGFLFFVAVSIPLNAFLAAQASTYWTLSFRRLDLDGAPATPLAAT